MVHICNPSYSRGGDRRIAAQAKLKTISERQTYKKKKAKGFWGMA
jgi:hypothetical protein